MFRIPDISFGTLTITYEKFTYVFIGDQYYLGAKSYKTNLVSVSWYLAKDSNAKTGVFFIRIFVLRRPSFLKN